MFWCSRAQTADVACFMLDRIFDNWCNESALLLDRATAAEIDSVAAEFVHAGPERLAVMEEAKKIMVAYMPYKVHVHRIFTDLAHPWVVGYHRNIFVREF